jgi:hypothetical protein
VKTDTECGVDAKQAQNYLESYNGIDNASGSGVLTDNEHATNFLVTTNPEDILTFLKSPQIKEIKDNTEQVVFNDALRLITPEDFDDVYKLMDLSVAKKVTQCLSEYPTSEEYVQNFEEAYREAIGDVSNPAVGTYRKTFEAEIDTASLTCKSECLPSCENEYAIGTPEYSLCITQCEIDCELKAINVITERYSWADEDWVDDPSNGYEGDEGKYFGRIPDNSKTFKKADGSYNTSEMWPECLSQEWWDDEWKERVFYAVDSGYTPDMGTPIYFHVKNAQSTTLRKITFSGGVAQWEALDPSESPSSPTPTLTLRTTRDDKGEEVFEEKMKFAVIVAGRKFAFQSRLDGDEKDITNYLEGENTSPDDKLFERKPVASDFNDIVCIDSDDNCGIVYPIP